RGEYGKSATEFIGAAYDIQSAIAGLKGTELSDFTKSSGILAAATKADTATITNYMGTMYGIFEKDAAALGNSNWVERVTGMTAQAVQMFKTDGNKMSQAFSSLGSSATAMGVDMAEQMAVLGMLSATMGGGEAATKYTAFLGGAVKAQEKLGLSFFDSYGKMLPMADMLESIQQRIGHFSTDEQFAILSDAFGSGEAVKLIQNLQSKTDELAQKVVELDKNSTMETAITMAKAMTDQSQRLENSWFAIRTAAFGMVLPAFNAVTGSIADGLMWLTSMTKEYPTLTTALSTVSIIALSFGGVVASLSLVMGIAKMMAGGWKVTMLGLTGILKLFRILTLDAATGTWVFNSALWANPITWVVAGILALIAAVGAMIYWWDEIKASFADTTWFKIIAAAIDGVIEMLNMIPGINIEWRAGELPDVPVPETQPAIAKAVPVLPDVAALEASRPSMDSTLIDYKRPENTPQLSKNMVNNLNSSESRTTHNVRQYGDVYITPQGGMTPEQLAEWDELNAG
uniref:phage tail tape measure protein n=1 Tax=Vibrio cholerae TaxID=666 RepID=UPI00069D769A